jgi:parallel beta-helix repeat protein
MLTSNCCSLALGKLTLSRWVLLACISLALTACGDKSPSTTTQATVEATVEETLRLALETAKAGDVIVVPEGTHAMTRSLILNADGVTIRGVGMDKSILSFKNQIDGAEGLLVNASNFLIEDLALEDTQGDALKINEGKNITIRRVRTEWTNGPSVDNGAYGIYPVQTENTLIEHSVAIAASDAGIYVGQSRNIVVRNNRAAFNVAGIEIENSVGADVYGNIAEDNTGGILVFNMPGIPMAGHSTRVYKNQIINNNTKNFGAPGSAVSGVPAGSGIVINSNDKVEVFANTLQNNNTANVLISSYYSANYAGQRELADEFDPFPEGIYLYDNNYQGGGTAPDRPELAALLETPLLAELGRLPDVVWDGFVRDNAAPETAGICIRDSTAIMLNVDFGNEGANATTNTDVHRCDQPKLAAIQL